MHELGIMTGVLDAVESAARDAGATKVTRVSLSVGEMTEAIEDALVFAFQALQEMQDYSLTSEAELDITMVRPRSHCFECDAEYEHDRFHMLCPECGGFATELIAGRELQIDSIEVDLPDDQPAEGEALDVAENPEAGEAPAQGE